MTDTEDVLVFAFGIALGASLGVLVHPAWLLVAVGSGMMMRRAVKP